jgi:hypothetical protein
MLRRVLLILAATYTLAGTGALLIGFVIPSDDPLAPVLALVLGAPWTFVLTAVDGWHPNSLRINVLLLIGTIALNAGLLWWWALTRRRRL